uniref:Putative secreted protein n=1 Tax=Anopheles marajoara TaxID=58244 RepID=A0A2M4C770_9DIPT
MSRMDRFFLLFFTFPFVSSSSPSLELEQATYFFSSVSGICAHLPSLSFSLNSFRSTSFSSHVSSTLAWFSAVVVKMRGTYLPISGNSLQVSFGSSSLKSISSGMNRRSSLLAVLSYSTPSHSL